MITFILLIATIVLFFWMVIKAFRSAGWHNGGTGERKAKAEYSRIMREEPDGDNAKLSEAEFVEQYVSVVPGILRYVLLAITILFVGSIASCTSVIY